MKKANIGPKIIISNPPGLKLFCSTIPVEKEMAFEGVETGKSKAEEQLSATIKGTANPHIPGSDSPKGTKIEAAAVLLIMLEMSTAMMAKTTATPTMGMGNREIFSIIISVRPTSTMAIPNARPPATNISVSHGNLLTSSALMTWKSVSNTIGMAEVAAMGIP